MVDVTALQAPNTFKLWLGVSKCMLPVKYFCSNKASFSCQSNFMEIIRLLQWWGNSGHPQFCGFKIVISVCLVAIDLQCTCSLLRPAFMLSSSTYFHVLFSLIFLHLQSQALITFSRQDHSLPCTWAYQCTLFSITNWSFCSFKPNISIK